MIQPGFFSSVVYLQAMRKRELVPMRPMKNSGLQKELPHKALQMLCMDL